MPHAYSPAQVQRKLVQCLHNINYRCTNPKDSHYQNYGGRGIQNHLNIWHLYQLWERDQAHLLEFASIDRIDNDGNYTLENCRFIEMSENRKRRGNAVQGRPCTRPRLVIRLTDAQNAQLQAHAKAEGLRLSTWARKILLTAE